MGGCGVAIYSLALGKGFSIVGDGFPSKSVTVRLSLALALLWGKKVSPKLRSRRDLLGGEDLGEWLHLPVWKKGAGLI